MSLKEINYESKNESARIFYIGLVCDLWYEFSNYLVLQEEVSNNILAGVKKIVREGSNNLKIIVFGRIFCVFSKFSSQKNAYAPILYKILTLWLLENYYDEKIREFLLMNMINIFIENPSIPVTNLIEPLIKQAQNIENINFNVFDFEFFLVVTRHPRFILKDAIILIDLCGKIILSDSIFYTTAEISFLIITAKFIFTNLLQEYLLKFISIVLKVFCIDASTDPKASIPKKLCFGLIEKIIKFNHDHLNIRIQEYFYSIYPTLKKIKDKEFEYLYKLLCEPNKTSLEMRLQHVSPNNRGITSLSSLPHARVILDLERIKQKRMRKESKERLEKEQKSLNEIIQKQSLKQEIAKRRIKLGVKCKVGEEFSSILFSNNFYEENSIELFRIHEETSSEIENLKITLKKYSRINRILFTKYSGSAYKNSIISDSTFDKIQHKKEALTESDFSKLLREYGILQNFLTIEEMKYIYSYLAKKLKVTKLSYEHFSDLIYMVSTVIFNREPYNLAKFPSVVWLESFYEILKNCKENFIPKTFFEEPDPGYGDRDVINRLNNKLKKDPDYHLPENYKKVKEIQISIEYKAFCGNSEQNIVLEIFDDIFFKAFNTHFLMPIIVNSHRIRAKGLMGLEDNKTGSIKYLPKLESNPGFSKLSPNIKLQVLSTQNLSGELILECGRLIDDLIYSIEKNSFVLISRYPKPAGTLTNRIIQEKLQKITENANQSERVERKRKQRKKMVKEEALKFQKEKEQKKTLEKEAEEKEILKAKLLEKKNREKREKERFDLEEKILQYKLNKIENELKIKDSGKLLRVGNNKISVSVDFSRPKSFEKVSPIASKEKSKAVSVPRNLGKNIKSSKFS